MDFKSISVESGVDKIQELISPVDSERLEIVVPDEYKGQYELPSPASKHIPNWYKKTDIYPKGEVDGQKSVRACMPFMEAMTFGWIIPAPVNISIDTIEGNIEWSGNYFDAVGKHEKSQVGGDIFPHDNQIIKFNLPYMLRTPEGVSTLFIPPLNRIEKRFQVFSGVVETDVYMDMINIPALLLQEEIQEVIEEGTPLVQAVPFKRDSVVKESETRLESANETELRENVTRSTLSNNAFYKNEVWEPKKASREVGGCPLGFGDGE